MSSGDSSKPVLPGNDEFAQAFNDLTRGEQTASVLEKQLSELEKKIEELLERADRDQKELDAVAEAKKSTNTEETPE